MRYRTSPLVHAVLATVLLLANYVAHSEARSGYFPVGNDEIYFELEGSGFPLVLASGGSGMDLRQWDLVAPHLIESYTVLRYDPRGIGKSDNPTEVYSDTADLEALLRHLAIEDRILIGLSSSGGFVLEYALQYPARVTGVIAAAPFVPGFQFSEAMLARLDRFSAAAASGKEAFLDSMLGDAHFVPAPLNRSIRTAVRENMGMNYDKGAGFDPTLAVQLKPPLIEQLTNISPSVLLLAGALDHAEVHRRNGFLGEQIPSNRQLAIADAGHNAPLENPTAFVQAIQPFLEEFGKR